MKKIAFLIGFMVTMMSFGQFSAPRLHYYKEIIIDSVSGTDSIYVYEDDNERTPFKIKSGYVGIIVEYYSVDDNDATFDIGVSNGYSFNSIDTAKLPLLLDLQNDSASVNGVLKGNTAGVTATKTWKSDYPVPYENLAFKLILNSVSSGTVKLWIYGYE